MNGENQAPPIGMVLRGRYRLIREIGSGRASRVFRAVDEVATRAGLGPVHVAIKIVASPGDLALLLHREARRLRQLLHPGVVRVFDMDTDGNLHFMVMEEVRGPTLGEALAEVETGGLDPRLVYRMIAELADAIGYIHAAGLVHGDIKPANIILRKGGPATLVDFNIACRVLPTPQPGDLEDTATILGRREAFTPLYASPQRLAGAELTPEDDVYSLAVVAFRALTGAHPFGKVNALEASQTGGNLLLPDMLRRGERVLFRQALSFADEDRFRTARLFAEALLAQRRVKSRWWSGFGRKPAKGGPGKDA